MARTQRIEYEGAVYHVTARGNERREIFRDDADREHFLRVLGIPGTVTYFSIRRWGHSQEEQEKRRFRVRECGDLSRYREPLSRACRSVWE